MSSLIRIEAISKHFGAVAAVDGVSLDVGANEFLALLGPSGCGKTTLLRLLAGFEQPDAGRILIDGQDVTGAPPYARPVNMMFQSYALFPHMSVADNVAFGLKQDGLSGAPLKERVREALVLVELETLAARKPHQLSGGQRQRVALARCIAKRPRALLLDEPLAALDKHLRERTQLELMALRQRLGISFIVVTHDQSEAMAMADRVAVMDGGKLLQVAPPRELYERPAGQKVARFFGDVNIWRGRISGAQLTLPELALETRLGDALPQGEVAAALRPERIRITAAPQAAECIVTGVVRDIVYLGTSTTYFVHTAAGGAVRVSAPNGDGAVAFARGDQVHLAWAAAAMMVLEP